MRKLTLVPPDAIATPGYLTAAAIGSLIQALPSGTAYCIGIVRMVMMRERLRHHKGGLARAALPLVLQLRGGGHRVERAMGGGRFSLDGRFDRASEGCLTPREVEPVRLGCQGCEVRALESSSMARLVLGKGSCHRAGRGVGANLGAAVLSVLLLGGVRVGWVRGVGFGASGEAGMSTLLSFLPGSAAARLIVVDTGVATKGSFAAATAHDARLGRLRRYCPRWCAPPPPTGKRGLNPSHGIEPPS